MQCGFINLVALPFNYAMINWCFKNCCILKIHTSKTINKSYFCKLHIARFTGFTDGFGNVFMIHFSPEKRKNKLKWRSEGTVLIFFPVKRPNFKKKNYKMQFLINWCSVLRIVSGLEFVPQKRFEKTTMGQSTRYRTKILKRLPQDLLF